MSVVPRRAACGAPARAASSAASWLVAAFPKVLTTALVTAIAFALLNAVFLGQAMAQATTPGAAPAPTSAAASPALGLVQGMVGLAFVVALIFGAGWLVRKIGPRARASGLVHVVGGASVGPREKVVVVRFGDQTLLLGVAPGQVSVLHAAQTADLPGTAPEGAAAAPGVRFADRLRAARTGA